MTATSERPVPSRRRRWWRWIKIAALVVIALAIAVRVSLPYLLPRVLNGVLARYGLTVRYDRLALSLLGGDLELWRLEVAPIEGGAPCLRQEYLRVAVAIGALLRGDLVVRRLESEGLDLELERDADGSLPLLRRFGGGTPSAAAPSAPAPTAPSAERSSPVIEFDLPLAVEALRVDRAHVHWTDRSVSPTVETRAVLDLHLADLGSPGHEVRLDLRLEAPSVLDSLDLAVRGTGERGHLSGTLELQATGARLPAISGYLAPLGIEPVASAVTARLHAQFAADQEGEALRASAAVTDLVVEADSAEAVAIERVAVEAPRIGREAMQLATHVQGLRARGERLESGKLRVAGIDLDVTPAGEVASDPEPADEPYRITFTASEARDLRATFTDRRVRPAADLALEVSEATLGALALGATHQEPVPISARLAVSGVARSIAVSGSLLSRDEGPVIDVTLDAEGLEPDPVCGYLAEAGLEPVLHDGSLRVRAHVELATLDETLQVCGTVQDLVLRDASGTLCELSRVEVSSFALNGSAGTIDLGDVAIAGPRLVARREADGALVAVGLRFGGARRDREVEGAPAPEPAAQSASPTIRIAKLRWQGLALDWHDEQVEPAAHLRLADLALDGTGLALGPGTLAGDWRCSLASPGIAERLDLEGRLGRTGDTVSVALRVSGTGITGRAIQPQLERLGFAPVLQDGALALALHGDLDLGRRGEIACRLQLENASLADAGPLWSVGKLVVEDLVLGENELRAASLELVDPHAALARDADGALVVSGFRLVSSAPPAVVEPVVEAPAPASSPPLAVELAHATVTGAELRWSDATRAEAVAATLTGSCEVAGMVLGRSAPPAQVHVSLAGEGIVDRLDLQGTLDLSPLQCDLTLDAAGLKAGPVAPYLPSGMAITLQDGRVRAKLAAAFLPNPEGGMAIRFAVRDLDCRDGAEGAALLSLDQMTVSIPALDPARRIDIDEVVVSGLEAEISRTASGELLLPGVRIGASSRREPGTTEGGGPVATPRLVANDPPLTLAKLEIDLRRLTWHDEQTPGAQPVEVKLHLANQAPVQYTTGDMDAPPLKLHLEGSAAPLIDRLAADCTLLLFAPEPSAVVDLEVAGIHGDRLASVLPSLAERIDLTELDEGRLRARLQAVLQLRRRHPLDFEIARSVGCELLVRSLSLENGADGELAGLDELYVDCEEFDPRTGSVRLAEIQISDPRALLRHDERGLHIAGLTLKPAPADATSSGAAPADPAHPAPATPAAGEPPEGERATAASPLWIDQIVISGLNLRYEELTCQPPLVLPLDGLDAEVRNFTMGQQRVRPPVVFQVVVNAGEVDVPVPEKSLIGGAVSGIVSTVTNQDRPTHVKRPLFRELSAQGRFDLQPRLSGTVGTSISGLELASFKAEAARAGVTVDAGVLDGRTTVTLVDDGSALVNTQLTFTHLSMSEDRNGPIRRYLRLPAPLDTVLYALRDRHNAIQLPLELRIPPGGMSRREVQSLVISTLGATIARALAGAPLRAAAYVTNTMESLVPFSLGDGERVDEPIVIEFGAGETLLDATARAALEPVLEKMRDDDGLELRLEHELGREDVACAQRRATPSEQDCRLLLNRLEAEQAETESERLEASMQVRAALATGSEDDARQAVERLRGLERRLGTLDRSVYRVYELLTPRAGIGADRRTRKACIDLAKARLEAIEREIWSQVANGASRLRAISPRFSEPEASSPGRVTLTLRRRSG